MPARLESLDLYAQGLGAEGHHSVGRCEGVRLELSCYSQMQGVKGSEGMSGRSEKRFTVATAKASGSRWQI